MATYLYLSPLRLNDSTGAPATNIPVKVNGTVYFDQGGTMPIPNNTPVTDSNGDISFYAVAGTYTLTYTPSNNTGQLVTVNLPLALGSYSTNVYVGSTGVQALRNTLGQPANPIRSNIEFDVFSGPLVDTGGSSVAASGVMVAVPVPVDVGMTVSKISFLVGATAASTPTHSFAALYQGTAIAAPVLIGQSTDGGTAAVAASARFDFTLTTATQITSAMAPNGYVWAAYAFTATTTLPSQVTIPCGAAAAQYRWFTNAPLYWSQTSGSGVAGTAPATLINASTLTVAPVVFLY